MNCNTWFGADNRREDPGDANKFDYDNAGNQTVMGATGISLAYDAENRMTQFEVVGSNVRELYDYDGEGRRVRHRHQVYTGGQWTTPQTTLYVYDAFGQLAAEYGDSTTNSECTTCYLTADPLGSTRLMTDQLGNPVTRYDYLPFGQEVPADVGDREYVLCGSVSCYGQTDAVRHKFTAKERDTETGLDYFGARYLSSAQARFTSVDPVIVTPERKVDPQQLNRYAYVRNNPLRFIDPTGEVLICTGSDSGACLAELQRLAGDAADRVTVDAKTGVVSFDTKDLDLASNEGANLINQLVGSVNTYGFAISDTALTAGGRVSLGKDNVSNLDITADPRYGNGKRPIDLPSPGIADQVTINPNVVTLDSKGRIVSLMSLSFHELAEAFSKIDGGTPYGPAISRQSVVNGMILIGPPEAGAHQIAIQREFKLRGQRPSLQPTGRAGDELKPGDQLIRDPHN